jgi:hypothetical protein
MNQSTVPEKKDQNAFIIALKFQNLKFVILKFWCYNKYVKSDPHIVTHQNFKFQIIMCTVRHLHN